MNSEKQSSNLEGADPGLIGADQRHRPGSSETGSTGSRSGRLAKEGQSSIQSPFKLRAAKSAGDRFVGQRAPIQPARQLKQLDTSSVQ